jgi:hypothetical protein
VPRSERDSYAECGEATRAAIEVANVRCTRFELRVLGAVIALTTSYSRLTDKVAATQIARYVYGPERATTSAQRDRATKALRELADAGIVVYEPGRGRSSVATIGLPEIQPPGDRLCAGNTGRSARETRVDPCAKSSPLDGHSEKCPEKSSPREKTAEKEQPPTQAQARIAQRLADAIQRFPNVDDWLPTIEALATRFDDKLIDACAGQTIEMQAGPRYLAKIVPDWYAQRTGGFA